MWLALVDIKCLLMDMENEKQYKLMIPTDLKALLQRVAENCNRSLSAQIVYVLQEWVEDMGIAPNNVDGFKPPSANELDLEGKVMALELVVADLLREAIETSRITDEQVKHRFDAHRASTFSEDKGNTLPEECISGGRVALSRMGAYVAIGKPARYALKKR